MPNFNVLLHFLQKLRIWPHFLLWRHAWGQIFKYLKNGHPHWIPHLQVSPNAKFQRFTPFLSEVTNLTPTFYCDVTPRVNFSNIWKMDVSIEFPTPSLNAKFQRFTPFPSEVTNLTPTFYCDLTTGVKFSNIWKTDVSIEFPTSKLV